MAALTYTIGLVEHVGPIGRDECGEQVFGKSQSIMMEASNGQRWLLTTWSALDYKRCHDPRENMSFWSHNPDYPAEVARGERLVQKIQAVIDTKGISGLNLVEHWCETDPCYGSEAYISGGYEEMYWMREREDAMMGI